MVLLKADMFGMSGFHLDECYRCLTRKTSTLAVRISDLDCRGRYSKERNGTSKCGQAHNRWLLKVQNYHDDRLLQYDDSESLGKY